VIFKDINNSSRCHLRVVDIMQYRSDLVCLNEIPVVVLYYYCHNMVRWLTGNACAIKGLFGYYDDRYTPRFILVIPDCDGNKLNSRKSLPTGILGVEITLKNIEKICKCVLKMIIKIQIMVFN